MNLLNIFEFIVLSSLIGSVIMLLILIIKRIFRNKLNSTFHYYIWLILLLKLILPFGPQTTFNISNLYENSYIRTSTNENTQKSQIASTKQLDNLNLGNSASTGNINPTNKSVINNYMNMPLKNKVNIKRVLCFIWLSGMALLIGIFFTGYKKLIEIVKISIRNIDVTHKEILYNCMKNMNIRTKVDLFYSSEISSPSLCGFLKPKILIPVKVAANVTDEEFKYILMHELTHLKNKDAFINWVITLLSMIYWFNPILLYGFHKMRQDREFSCDSRVISCLNKGENVHYGNALIRVLELAKSSDRLVGITPMVMNRLEIKRRIIMISKYKKLNIKGILFGTVAFVIIGGLGIALNTSNLQPDKNIVSATTLQTKTPVTTPKSPVNNTSSLSASTVTKNSSSNVSKPIVPFSSDIVIYNSHPNEAYPSGMTVTDVAAIINDKLVKEGLRSRFIKNATTISDYNNSYQISRDLITKNIKSYSNTILIDIHRDETQITDSSTRKIMFILTQKNPRYVATKKFTDDLMLNIKSSKAVNSGIRLYDYGISYYNQDLSNYSELIEIGNNKSSDSDIDACVKALLSALKNTQLVSSNK